MQVDILGLALAQQAVMTVLVLGLMLTAYAWTRLLWPYVITSVLFAGYSGLRFAAAWTSISPFKTTSSASWRAGVEADRA